MKVAVLYTGSLRTIKNTIRHLKNNVLLNSDVEVFACIQNDTTISNSDWEVWIRKEMGCHLKDLVWFSPNDEHKSWIAHRDYIVSLTNLTQPWKNYLMSSGSIIEYFQLYLAYSRICKYEDVNYRFNYIIRMRTDIISAKPLDFHWLDWTDEQVQNRIETINSELTASDIPITPANTLKYFMTTIISDDVIKNIKNINAAFLPSKSFTIPETVSDINNFIKTGDYILTIRQNNLYICNRELFHLIPSLAYMYGFLRTPVMCPHYWFNAENQFRGACYLSGITVFDYCTTFEENSLYKYVKENYFDNDYNIINNTMLWCIVRH